MTAVKPLLFLVDDDWQTLTALARVFQSEFRIQSFSDPLLALAELDLQDPALVLTDSIMPQMSGLDFLKRVRSARPNSVRVILSGQLSVGELSQALHAGLIHRFFVKPWENEILKLQVLECLEQRKILLEKDHLAELALTDPVTQLGNHRFFQEQFRTEVERARRHSRPVCLMMMDIDHFKLWNDQFGHPAGDALLNNVARLLVQGLRTIDWIARYGGDEFAMILPDTKVTDAFVIAERLRNIFFADPQHHKGPVSISLSFGLSSFPENGSVPAQLIESADQALYQAKKLGRNQSKIAGVP